MKKIISFVLCTALLFTFFPFNTAYAYNASADVFSKDGTSDSDTSTDESSDSLTSESDIDENSGNIDTFWKSALYDFCMYFLQCDAIVLGYDLKEAISIYDYSAPYERARELNSDSQLIASMSEEEAHLQLVKMLNQIKTAHVNIQSFNALYELCRDEKNDDCYYCENIWNEFKFAVDQARKIYEAEADGKYSENGGKTYYEEINSAYFGLKDAFNALSCVNMRYGDIDNDGAVTLKDVTALQRYLAGLERFNISQTLLSSNKKYGEIDLTVVVSMQKYIAGLSEFEVEQLALTTINKGYTENAVFKGFYSLYTVDIGELLMQTFEMYLDY